MSWKELAEEITKMTEEEKLRPVFATFPDALHDGRESGPVESVDQKGSEIFLYVGI